MVRFALNIQPWAGRSFPLAHRTGSQIFTALFGADAIATLLESPYPSLGETRSLSRYSICAGGPRRLESNEWALWTPKLGKILPFLQTQLDHALESDLRSDLPSELPFVGGWLGWLGYDLAWEIERLPYQNEETLPFPVAYWYEPDCFAVLDHFTQQLWLAVTDSRDFDRLESCLNAVEPSPVAWHPIAEIPTLKFLTTQEPYQAAILRAKDYIQRGDIFQTNLSLRFEAQTQASSWDIYQALHSINPSPFASYWRSPFGDIISCSPERLVALDESGWADTRPIAGTRPRGETSDYDIALADELRSNEKERAEHIMLVDLERNDLGRVCAFGSVVVDELLVIERYSHVMHLVSNVRGKLRSDVNAIDLIRAVFPGGTITGCPKVRCMEIIEELEPVRRSLFYGSCGYLDQRGRLDLNILIRTLLYTKLDLKLDLSQPEGHDSRTAMVWGQVGAGIVADSEPEREWAEALQKAIAQIRALEHQSRSHPIGSQSPGDYLSAPEP